ncbi:MAG: glycosyltransferase family 4 protein [Anaerolineae bacterium]
MPYYRMGGISQYTILLIQALADLDVGNEYTIFHNARDGRSYLPESAPNFHRWDVWTPCHHRWERWALSAELVNYGWRRGGLDVLHSPDFIPPVRGARRRIVTIHDLNFLYFPELLTAESRRYYADQIRRAVREADHMIADSEATRRDLVEELGVPSERITAIPLAANPQYAQPPSDAAVTQVCAQFNLPRGFILFVGTLEPRKNLPALIRAYHAMRHETGIDAPLVLVGSKGWMYEDVFATAEALGLRGAVYHLDGINNEQLAALYSAAAVLVLPSFYEGFGLPVLEAMHCGCPVVASDRGSLPEVVGKAGVLLGPEDDVSAWASALARVINDGRFREDLVKRGFEQVKKFSWQKTAAATLQVYLAPFGE